MSINKIGRGQLLTHKQDPGGGFELWPRKFSSKLGFPGTSMGEGQMLVTLHLLPKKAEEIIFLFLYRGAVIFKH